MFRILNRAFRRSRPKRAPQTQQEKTECEIWLVSTRRPGHVNQCLAIIEALGRTPDRHIEIPGKSRIDPWWKQWAMKRRVELETLFRLMLCPWPAGALVVCSGRSVIPLCHAWGLFGRRANFCLYIGTPKSRLAFADCLVRARHEILPDEEQGGREMPVRFHRPVEEIVIEGVPTRPVPEWPSGQGRRACDHQRRLHVVIGGPSPGFSYEGPLFRDFLRQLAAIQRHGEWSVALIASARTSPLVHNIIREEMAATLAQWPNLNTRAEFIAFLAQADALVVCPDSITMVCEACRLGSDVFVPELDLIAQEGPHVGFLARFRSQGWILPFSSFPNGRGTVILPDQTKIALGVLQPMLARKGLCLPQGHKSISRFQSE